MRRIRLTAMEHVRLEHTCKTTSDRRLRDRCQAVLMANRSRKRRAIAQDVGVHRATVRRWLTQYHEHGAAGRQSHWAPGQPGRMPETVAPTIHGWVPDGPQGWGLVRAHWTSEELATHRYQTTGIAVRRTAMRDFCQRHGLRPSRPTYHSLRGDPQKQQAAREELAACKQKPRQGRACC
jgi:transposase